MVGQTGGFNCSVITRIQQRFLISFFFLLVAPSGPPTNITTTSTSITSFSVSWDPPLAEERNGAITGYVLRLSRPRVADEFRNSAGTREEFVGLLANTEYRISVAAVTQAGTGPYSNTQTFSTSVTG